MNPEEKKKYIMLGGLFAVLLGVVVWQFTKGTATPATPAGKTGAKTTGTAASKTAGAKTAAAKVGATVATDSDIMFREADVDIDALLANIAKVNFDYEVEHIDRDPMAPLVGEIANQQGALDAGSPASAVAVLRKSVTGILYDAVNPAAVVDNVVVREGFTYPGGVVVESIERDHVVFRVGDSLVPVHLKEMRGTSNTSS